MISLPLSVSQKELWAELQAWPGSSHLNIAGFSGLKGPINRTFLKEALDELVKNNDTLRLVINNDDTQTLLDFYDFPLTYIDLTSSSNFYAEADELQKNWLKQPFLWQQSPPIRFAILSASDNQHFFSIQALHTSLDGWSMSVILRLWAEYYNWILSGKVGKIDLVKPYQDYISDSLSYLQSNTFYKDQAFWQEYLPVLPDFLLEPRYKPSIPNQVPLSHIESCELEHSLLVELAGLAKQLNVTSFHCVLAALAVCLFRSHNKTDFIIGIPTLNRGGNKYKNTLGMFVSVLPVRFQLAGCQTIKDIIQNISRELKQSYRHAKYPLSEQFKRLNVIQQGKERIFDVIFSYENFEFDCHFGEAKLADIRQTFPGQSRYPLAISLTEFNDFENAEMVLEGGQQYFTAEETRLVGLRIVDLTKQLLTNPDIEISQFELCPQDEKNHILHATQNQQVTSSYLSSYHQVVAEQVELTPDATALLWADSSLTYKALWLRVLSQAEQLIKLGVSKGDCIALAIERGPEVVINMLAVSVISGQFLIVDTEIPVQRLQTIVEKANVKLTLHNENNNRFNELNCILSAVPAAEKMSIDEASFEVAKWPEVELDSPAYVLFTSGSTGQPKGVQVSHKALIKRMAWIVDHWQIDHKDISLQATQVNFDPALVELILPLLKGGAVAFAPAGRLLPESLPPLAAKYAATLTAFVPSTLTRFLDGMDDDIELSLRVCCCGGEILSPEVARRFINQTGADLYNVYGPTEATIFATAWKVKAGQEDFTQLPVGSQLTDTQVHVLSDDFQQLPYGVVGNVYLSGDTLANGYLNDPEKTTQSFVSLEHLPEKTLYKTGDRGWLDTDGVLHFSGRKDRQIKLRGYRIEIPEIEHALMRLPEVKQAAVKLSQVGTSQLLVAWVTVHKESSNDVLKSKLAKTLPDYMLPTRIIQLAEMPYTANGKINYSELPLLEIENKSQSRKKPIGKFETDILGIWKQALKRDDIGVTDNFFEYGGDSLAAVVTLGEIEEKIGKRLSLHQLVENPTISQLVECIESELELPKLLISLGDTTRSISLYIAASGNGDLLRFEALAQAMHGICDLHMLQPPGNDTKLKIEELAALYAERIAEREQGEVYIAGFSVGGLAALETAKLLAERNIKVKELFIVDTILMKLPKWLLASWRNFSIVLAKSGMFGKKLLTTKAYRALSDRGLYMQVKGMHDYQASDYSGDTVLIKSSRFRMTQNYLVRGWKKVLSGRVSEFTIETSHSGFFEPGRVDKLAKLLSTRIKDK